MPTSGSTKSFILSPHYPPPWRPKPWLCASSSCSASSTWSHLVGDCYLLILFQEILQGNSLFGLVLTPLAGSVSARFIGSPILRPCFPVAALAMSGFLHHICFWRDIFSKPLILICGCLLGFFSFLLILLILEAIFSRVCGLVLNHFSDLHFQRQNFILVRRRRIPLAKFDKLEVLVLSILH